MPLKLPTLSVRRRRSLTYAAAPDVCPTSNSPTLTLPWNSPLAVDAISLMSMFRILVLDAYDVGNVAAPVPYGVVT